MDPNDAKATLVRCHAGVHNSNCQRSSETEHGWLELCCFNQTKDNQADGVGLGASLG